MKRNITLRNTLHGSWKRPREHRKGRICRQCRPGEYNHQKAKITKSNLSQSWYSFIIRAFTLLRMHIQAGVGGGGRGEMRSNNFYSILPTAEKQLVRNQLLLNPGNSWPEKDFPLSGVERIRMDNSEDFPSIFWWRERRFSATFKEKFPHGDISVEIYLMGFFLLHGGTLSTF